MFPAYIKIKILVSSSLNSNFGISPPLLNLIFNYTILFLINTLINIIFLLNRNILKPSLLIIRFLVLILILPKSFFTLKVFTPQLEKYSTLLRFSAYISPLISIVQIIILLLKLNGLASPLIILINGRDTGIYILVLKSLINLVI